MTTNNQSHLIRGAIYYYYYYYYVLFVKIIFLCSFSIFSVLITKDKPRTNQGRTKDEPTNSQTQKSTFVK